MTALSFSYKALTVEGAIQKGMTTAESWDDAYRRLSASGLKPVKIKPVSHKLLGRSNLRKVSLPVLSQFTYQFSILVEARIPISEGLRSIADQEPNARLRTVIDDIAHQIEAGETITSALTNHRDLFGDIYIATIHAAEVSGRMPEVLARLAAMLDQEYEMRKQLKAALMYPLCVVMTLTVAVTFLMIAVVPRFAQIFAQRGVELPLPTQVVVGCSDILRTYWYLVIGLIFASIWGVHRAWRTRSLQTRVDRWFNSVPFLASILKGVAVSRFATILSIALRSGLSLLDAIDMAGLASGRPLLRAEARKMHDQVNAGGRLSDVLDSCKYLPAFARRMIASGEDAGNVPKMCDIVAKNYMREVAHLVKNVATVIEPVLIVGLAGVVLIIALAIFMPMWKMSAIVS